MLKLNDSFDSVTLEMLQQTREYCQRFLLPMSDEIDAKNRIDRDLWRSMGKMGVLGISVDSTIGGGGMGYLEHCLVVEEITRSSSGVALSYLEQTSACIDLIKMYGTDIQKKLFLPKLITGEFVGATAISEGSTSGLQPSINCKGELKRDQIVITGEKCWVINGSYADIVIALVKTDNSESENNTTAVIVPGDDKRLVRGPSLEMYGMRGSGVCNMSFKACAVPIEYTLGNINQGRLMMEEAVLRKNVINAAAPIGLTRAALDKVVPLLRDEMDSKIGGDQVVLGAIADIYSRYQGIRTWVHKLAQGLQAGEINKYESQAVLYSACNLAVESCTKIMGLSGAEHYLRNDSITRIFRDATFYNVGLYNKDQLRSAIGQQVLQL